MTRTIKNIYETFQSADNIIIDTGPLLIHAVGAFQENKLKDVCLCREPTKEFEFLNRLFASRKSFYITPYILSELLYHIRKKLRLNEEGVDKFFNCYREFLNKIGEFHFDKEKIINNKYIKFGLADISLVKAYEEGGSLIFSDDGSFCRLCEKENIEYIEYRTFFYTRYFM